jgi:hypothetical protein
MHKDKVVRFTSHSGDHLSSVVFFVFIQVRYGVQGKEASMSAS